MTPEEIEILIQEAQTLIEQIRAETQKGGNTKERVSNTFTKLNNIITQLNERPSGGGDLTLEQARENGNVFEGDVLFNIGGFNAKFDYNPDNDAICFYGEDGKNVVFPAGLMFKDSLISHELNLGSEYLFILSNYAEFKGIVGNEEFDKQGDRKAFAQMSDVYAVSTAQDLINKTNIYHISVSQDGNIVPIGFTKRVNLDYLNNVTNVSSFDIYQLFYGSTVGVIRSSLSEIQDDINALSNTQVTAGYTLRFRVVLIAGKDFATAELKTTDI